MMAYPDLGGLVPSAIAFAKPVMAIVHFYGADEAESAGS